MAEAKSRKDKPEQEQGASPYWLDTTLTVFLRFRRFAWDAMGILLIALAVMTTFALLNLTGGSLLSPWAGILRRWLGWGSVLFVIVIGTLGILMINPRIREKRQVNWSRVLALEISFFAFLAVITLVMGSSIARAEAGLDGGLIGWGLADFLYVMVGPVWRVIILILVLSFGILVGLGQGMRFFQWIGTKLRSGHEAAHEELPPTTLSVAAPDKETVKEPVAQKPKKKKEPPLPPEFQKNFQVEKERDKPSEPLPRSEELPPLDLLVTEKEARPDERNINQTAGMIEKTLAEFGIPAKVVGFQVGPTVTQFAVEPGFVNKPGVEGDENKQKIRVSQISGLARDLALALSAERLRIQAPVPGRPYVGVEVPNVKATTVRLRPILESEAFNKVNSPLAIAMGRNVSGEPVVADLASMPHLLIAGATGSGKSICITAITTGLVMNNTPDDLRLVMLDPKMVELVRFNGMPHLFGKVETELERMLAVLRWTVVEMDRRYKLLEEVNARDIQAYNSRMKRRKNGQTLPRIILLIDELADLMMTAADQTEHALVRLAQMARATGIHLVLATQRPSTDVVTGLIKANFPARLSFAVASAVDSRVILDTQGAESLLGRGDMLFLPPEAGTPLRAQGVMITDQEVEQVIKYWRENWELEDEAPLPWEEVIREAEEEARQDALVERAIEIVQSSGRASASMLQRRLRIGYPRAARLIDQLEELGVVGPAMGPGKEREVLIGPDEEFE